MSCKSRYRMDFKNTRGVLDLYIEDTKYERHFAKMFTKSSLKSLGIKHSVNEVLSALIEAKNTKKKHLKHNQYKLSMRYIAATSTIPDRKINAINTSNLYQVGDLLVLMFTANNLNFSIKSGFKLDEIIIKRRKGRDGNKIPQLALTHSSSIRNIKDRNHSKPNRRSHLALTRSSSTRVSRSKKKKNKKIKTKEYHQEIEEIEGNCDIDPQTQKIIELELQIKSLKKDNNYFSKQVEELSVKRDEDNSRKDDDNQRFWFQQKIQDIQNNKYFKRSNINFSQCNEIKDGFNMSLNIITKLLRENEKQAQCIGNNSNELAKELKLYKDEQYILNRRNKEFQKEIGCIRTDKNNEILRHIDEKSILVQKLQNAIKQINLYKNNNHNDNEYEGLINENQSLWNHIQRLKHLLDDTTKKSMELIKSINISSSFSSNVLNSRNKTKNKLNKFTKTLSSDSILSSSSRQCSSNSNFSNSSISDMETIHSSNSNNFV